MKKYIKQLICLCVILLLVPIVSNAQNPVAPKGSGTVEDPYIISTINNLSWLSNQSGEWSKYFIQSSDIDASDTKNWNVGDHDLDPNTADKPMGFSPIGDDPEEGKRQMITFKGSYDGKGFVIIGLFINMPGFDNIGMFGMISNGASISNLKLEYVTVTGKHKIGGLVGFSRDSNTTINYCSTDGGSVSGNRFMGGLIGYNLYGCTIANCYSGEDVNGKAEIIGGLIGYNYTGTIHNCYATGNVTGNKHVGGLTGYNNELSTIDHCHATGNVTANDINCGGLVGYNYNSTISHCYALGEIRGGENIGGLVGELANNSNIDNSHAKGIVYGWGKGNGGLIGKTNSANPVNHCYATGDVIGSYYLGGLVGINYHTTIEECYATGNINPDTDNRAYCGGLAGVVYHGYIFKCFALGNVNNQSSNTDDMDKVGGLIGEANNGSTIDMSCAKGDVYGYRLVGGLVGNLVDNSKIQNCYSRGKSNGYFFVAGMGYFEGGCTIKNSYATGKITATDPEGTFNGLVPRAYGHVQHSYYDKETTGIYNADPNSGLGKSTAEMKTQSTYAGWGFGNYWSIDPDINDGYPYLIGTPQQIEGLIVWEGSNDSNWSNPDNWNFGFVPDMDDDVLIPETNNDPILAASDRITINSLTVENNAILILESTAENTASLIVTSQASGDVQIKCFLESNIYHFIHIPVNTGQTNMKDLATTEGDTYLGLTPGDNNDIFEKWNEEKPTDNLWTDLLHGTPPIMDYSTFDMSLGYGYLNTDTIEPDMGTTPVFTGEIQTGDISFHKTYTEDGGEGYHVIGNPFTSTISINNFADYGFNFLRYNASILHDNYEAVYLWRSNNIMNNASNDYEVICNCGFSGIGNNSNFGYDFIEPCQGFIVRIEHEGNIIFTNNLRKHGNSEFHKLVDKTWPGIHLFAESEFAKTSTKIGFNESMSKWMDRSFDVATLKGNTGANLYSRIINESDHFAVQSLPTFTDSVICGIDIINSGEYTFSTYQKDMINVTLIDTETGETTDMLNNTYTVFIPEGNYESRFILRLSVNQNTGFDDHLPLEGKIYSFKKTIYLEGINGLVNIYDLYGNCIKSIETNGSKKLIPMDMFVAGVYIVKTEISSKKLLLE